MKKLLIAGVLTLSVVYANEASLELEHAIKSPSSIEDNGGDMSAMKAAGKCGAGVSSMKHTHTPSTAKGADKALHKAITTPSSVEDAGTHATLKHAKHVSKQTQADLELEHAIKSPSGIEDNGGDMSAMKAAGKCGSR